MPPAHLHTKRIFTPAHPAHEVDFYPCTPCTKTLPQPQNCTGVHGVHGLFHKPCAPVQGVFQKLCAPVQGDFSKVLCTCAGRLASVLSENTEQPAPTSENALENTFWGLNITPGDLLRGFRLKHGLSQAQLAKKTGIGQSVLSAYENGRRPITRRAAVRIGTALGEDPEKILFAPELGENC